MLGLIHCNPCTISSDLIRFLKRVRSVTRSARSRLGRRRSSSSRGRMATIRHASGRPVARLKRHVAACQCRSGRFSPEPRAARGCLRDGSRRLRCRCAAAIGPTRSRHARPRRRRQCVRMVRPACSALLRQVVRMLSSPVARSSVLFNGRRSRPGTCPPTSHVLFESSTHRRDRRRMIQRGWRLRGMVINSDSHEVSPRLDCPRHWFSHRRSPHSIFTIKAANSPCRRFQGASPF